MSDCQNQPDALNSERQLSVGPNYSMSTPYLPRPAGGVRIRLSGNSDPVAMQTRITPTSCSRLGRTTELAVPASGEQLN